MIGMARRPFDIAAHGWEKVEYRRGDVLDRDSVDSLVEEADVVVHLAFVIVAGGDESREINLEGSRNVFEAAAAAGAKRLVYTSSVAAYGFHRDLPDAARRGRAGCAAARAIPTRPTRPRSRTELERGARAAPDTDAYVFRPCIVAGPDATLLLDLIPLVAVGQKMPGPLRWALGRVPALRPVLPDPGVPLPARPPGRRRRGALRGRDRRRRARRLQPRRARRADDLRPRPRARLARGAGAAARGQRHRRGCSPRSRILPDEAAWIEAIRRPVLMDTTRARRKLHWMPHHDARQTLRQTVAAARAKIAASRVAPWEGDPSSAGPAGGVEGRAALELAAVGQDVLGDVGAGGDPDLAGGPGRARPASSSASRRSSPSQSSIAGWRTIAAKPPSRHRRPSSVSEAGEEGGRVERLGRAGHLARAPSPSGGSTQAGVDVAPLEGQQRQRRPRSRRPLRPASSSAGPPRGGPRAPPSPSAAARAAACRRSRGRAPRRRRCPRARFSACSAALSPPHCSWRQAW